MLAPRNRNDPRALETELTLSPARERASGVYRGELCLELEPSSDLNCSWEVRGGCPAEVCVRRYSGRVESQIVAYIIEINAIEEVVELPANLELGPFMADEPWDVEGLHQAGIHVGISRSAEAVAPDISLRHTGSERSSAL